MEVIRSHSTVLHSRWEGRELCLRPMMDTHLPLLYEWNTRQEVLFWCEGDDILAQSEEDVRGIYGSIARQAYMFILYVDGTPVGDCWIQEMNLPEILESHNGKAIKRIDLTIYEKALWGKGLGGQALKMLVSFGFQACKADLIYAITEDYNIRCQRCIQRCGFQLERRMEHPPTSKGSAELCYVMTRDMFLGGRDAQEE